MADARIEIEDARNEEPPASEGVAANRDGSSRGSRLAWAGGGALLTAAVAAAIAFSTSRAPHAGPALRSVLPLPAGARLWTERPSVAISPDGRTVVFPAVQDGVIRLFRRPLGGSRAEPIAGAEGGSRPFFSPDGQWVGFISFLEAAVMKVPLGGGAAVLLAHAPPSASGATWGTDGRIVMTLGLNRGLISFPDTGGEPTPLTKLDAAGGEHAHIYPQWLPGYRAILFTVRSGRGFTDVPASNTAVLDTTTGKWKTVVEGASFARYGGGRILFVRGSAVYSVPFDVSRLEVTGPSASVGEDIAVDPGEGTAQIAISPDGTLAFVSGPAIRVPTTSVILLDRSGKESALPMPAGSYRAPRLSPDGRRLALVQAMGVKTSIVVFDRKREVLSTLTPDAGRFISPVWSPDGRRIAFAHVSEADPVVSVKNSDGSGEIGVLTQRPPAPALHAELPTTWSPDGGTIGYVVLYQTAESRFRTLLSTDIWLQSLGGKKDARPWLETPYREYSAAFSPDGKWIAYTSDESGAFEVYVRPYPGPGASLKVSTSSGMELAWTRGGREIVYRTGARGENFMSVEIQTAPELSAGPPRLLFTAELAVGSRNNWGEFDVSADGNEIIGTRPVRVDEPPRDLNLVTGWAEEAAARRP